MSETSVGRVLETTEFTQLSARDGVLMVDLEHPDALVTEDVLDVLVDASARAGATNQPLVIRSTSAQFACGADLERGFRRVLVGDASVLTDQLVRFQWAMSALRSCSQPVVVAVDGRAISGGCEIVMHASRVVASPSAQFGLREACWGLLPGGGGLKELARIAASRAMNPGDHQERLLELTRLVTAGTEHGSTRAAIAAGYLEPDDVDDVESMSPDQLVQWAKASKPPQPEPASIPCAPQGTHEWICEALTVGDDPSLATDAQLDVARRIAHVLSGGGSGATALPSHAWFELERHHFVELASHPATRPFLRELIGADSIDTTQGEAP